MNKEIKLGIKVAVFCCILFLLIILIGNINKEKVNSHMTGDSNTEGMIQEESVEETNSNDIGQYNEYLNFAIANVSNYVNVRQQPNTDCAIVGKIYDGAVAQIVETVGEGENAWFQIISGNVEGYIKAEYFVHGQEAAAVMDQYISKYIKVNADRLNVREGQTTNSRRIGYICTGERLQLLEDYGEWILVQYTEDIKGYVAAQYVTICEEYVYAKNDEDEKQERAFEKELKERAGISEEVVKEQTTISVKPPSQTYSTNNELRKAIIDYAMQFLGNRYIHGGQSLSKGTDCSGFTMYVLAEFGYSISRTPQGQYTGAGRAISYSEVQPGDIICYSSNGGKSCTHVGFYIGDGKILHAANSKDGVKISSATYTSIYGVRNVVD